MEETLSYHELNELSQYEKTRLKNIAENKKMLESLGLLRTFKPILQPAVFKKVLARPKKSPVKRKIQEVLPDHLVQNKNNKKRRSLRIKGAEPNGEILLPDEDEKDEAIIKQKMKIKRENVFGAIEGVPVGTFWETRLACSADSVHRPTVAGIHGNESVGCFSIALSGGYEDDIDLGESFTYTGSGGRDLKGTKSNPKNLRTAAQSKDQTMSMANLALSLNVTNRQPVRVVRGYKNKSQFAPEYGYRYDGLYTVEKCWSCTGLSGFLVYKYILKRADEAPPPWVESATNGVTQSVQVATEEEEVAEKKDEEKQTEELVSSEEQSKGNSDGFDTEKEFKEDDISSDEKKVEEKKREKLISSEEQSKGSNGDIDREKEFKEDDITSEERKVEEKKKGELISLEEQSKGSSDDSEKEFKEGDITSDEKKVEESGKKCSEDQPIDDDDEEVSEVADVDININEKIGDKLPDSEAGEVNSREE